MSNSNVHQLHDRLLGVDEAEASPTWTLVLFSIIVVITGLVYQRLTLHDDIRKLPLINGAKPWSFFCTAEKTNFMLNAPHLIDEGLKTVGSS